MKVVFNSPKKNNAQIDAGVKVPYTSVTRVAFKIRWYFILLLTFSPVALLIWYISHDWIVTSAPGIVTTEPQLIVASGEGTIDEIYFSIGEDVKQGNKLMKVISSSLQSSIAERQNQLMQLEFDWESYNKVKITALNEEIRIALEATRKQEKVYLEYEKYKTQNLVSSAEFAAVLQIFTQSKLSYQQALQKKIDEMRKIQELSSSGPLSMAKNEINRELAEMNSKLSQLQPTAPKNGQIIDILVKKGDRVFKQMPLALYSSTYHYQVISYVSPKFIEQVQLGKKAEIQFASGHTLMAHVGQKVELSDKIPSSLADPFEGQKSMLKVKLVLDERIPEQLEIEGLPVTVKFN
ncbi:hemolysin D (plasmid) [Photobacterium sp. DA100]|uniref:HlyD family secretion protein n=1 Tax=Photobacterium sp. DA100 TaxID=3027472 RepID=UPI002479BA77|nr:hemolysin D [Photobacterium sp. DA100]WEM45362.1 hemolysin D [Photobacterium sp. DA100]